MGQDLQQQGERTASATVQKAYIFRSPTNYQQCQFYEKIHPPVGVELNSDLLEPHRAVLWTPAFSCGRRVNSMGTGAYGLLYNARSQLTLTMSNTLRLLFQLYALPMATLEEQKQLHHALYSTRLDLDTLALLRVAQLPLQSHSLQVGNALRGHV